MEGSKGLDFSPDDTLIFGGSFDPPHLGHLAILSAACALYPWKRVLVIPNRSSLDKEPIASAEHRLRLCELAFKNLDTPIAIDSRELLRAPPTYTIDTLLELKAEGIHRPCLILGSDTFKGLSSFKDHEKVIALARFLVFKRGTEVETPTGLSANIRLQFEMMPTPHLAISSTQLREWLATSNGEARKWLSNEVYFYLKNHKLYGMNESL